MLEHKIHNRLFNTPLFKDRVKFNDTMTITFIIDYSVASCIQLNENWTFWMKIKNLPNIVLRHQISSLKLERYDRFHIKTTYKRPN